MGPGLLGWTANVLCIVSLLLDMVVLRLTLEQSWTLFICVIFSLPTILPVTPDNMNYASVCPRNSLHLILISDILCGQVITGSVIILTR